MPTYLDEDMVGQDPTEICYPHLLLCMGVTVLMADGTLIGGHFTTPTTEAGVAAEMVRQINAHPSAMYELYCAGNFPVHLITHKGQDVPGKAQLLGFHGDAYSFDTSSIKPKDGTFVTVLSNGPNHNCSIFYKRDEKARGLYQKGSAPTVKKISSSGKVSPAPHFGTVGLTGPIHKLHQADFLHQLKHYAIP